MGNSSSWLKTFDIIKQKHDAAYYAIEEAISLEEQERPREAIEKYKAGILLIDEALNTTVTCPDNPDSTWEQACTLIQKLKRTRAEVIMRINSLTSSSPLDSTHQLTAFTQAATSSDIPTTYADLATALSHLDFEDLNTKTAEILYFHEGVRLYYISPDGSVTQASEPDSLYIAALPGRDNIPRRVFLQIGDFVYPLVPGVSPCYRTNYGAFILPDIQSDIPGSTIGIILPSDADASVYDLLESILLGVLGQASVKPPEAKRARRALAVPEPAATGISYSIAGGLVKGAQYVSQGLVAGAQKFGSFLNSGTPRLINSITPDAEPTTFSPRVTKGFEIVSNTSCAAAQFTGFMATKVSTATQALGRYLAPHVQKQGTRLLTSAFNVQENEASNTVSGVLTVAAGAFEGFSTIYEGLDRSASILGNSLSNNTVKVISHKYGPSAGHIAGDTFNTVGNVLSIKHDSKFFTPKGLAKKTAKQAGQAVLGDIVHAENSNTLYPNLPAKNSL